MSEINPWLASDEVTIGGQNQFRITEDELVDAGRNIDSEDDPTLDQVFTVARDEEGGYRPVTFREIIHGDGSGRPAMGILSSTPPSELNTSPHRLVAGLALALAAIEHPLPAKPNRAARREDRKRQRQARKRARR